MSQYLLHSHHFQYWLMQRFLLIRIFVIKSSPLTSKCKLIESFQNARIVFVGMSFVSLHLLTITNMLHIENRLHDIRSKINRVKENHNNHFRYPKEIIKTLTIIEMSLEDAIFSMKSI